MPEADELEAVLARADALEAELAELQRVHRALEAGEPVAVPAVHEPEAVACSNAPGAGGAAYRDDLEAARARAAALAEEVASLRRQVEELAEGAERDAEARKAREIAKLIEAADRREEQAARDFARRKGWRLPDIVPALALVVFCSIMTLGSFAAGWQLVAVIFGSLAFVLSLVLHAYK